jgi:hypothetical protein
VCQLGARLDAELGKHLSEVVLDGGPADEQLLGDLSVRRTLRDEL